MKAKLRFILAACVLGLLMTGPFAITALPLFADARDAERAAFAEFLVPRLPLGGLMTLFGLIAGLILLHGLFQQYVHGLLRMAETLRYNSRARLQFKALAQGPTSMSGGQLLRAQMAPVLGSAERAEKVGIPPIPPAKQGGDDVSGQAAPAHDQTTAATMLGAELQVTGYVLTIENITRNFEREAERDQALQSLTDGNRAALANIRAAVETLIDTPEMEQDYRERFTRITGAPDIATLVASAAEVRRLAVVLHRDEAGPALVTGVLSRLNDAIAARVLALLERRFRLPPARWCLSLSEWRESFAAWVRTPEPEALLNAAIFFDFRPLAGDVELAAELRRVLSEFTRGNEIFLRMMTVNALAAAPPLGRLRDFVTEAKSGGAIDLKKFGSRIFVDAARIPAPGNRIDPDRLNEFDRRVLLEALRQARTLQQGLKTRFHIET
ncbi:MAG: putative nucleotidyltransferase substrate binding domain-containing protein [Sulfuritalea sp.]|nr:putative nucleotidyltransferase substrate binding domain-containing protein [Sulfuritalea sp.]